MLTLPLRRRMGLDVPDVELPGPDTVGNFGGILGRAVSVGRGRPRTGPLTRGLAEAEGFEPSIGLDPKRD